jgi:hypothetical protein
MDLLLLFLATIIPFSFVSNFKSIKIKIVWQQKNHDTHSLGSSRMFLYFHCLWQWWHWQYKKHRRHNKDRKANSIRKTV